MFNRKMTRIWMFLMLALPTTASRYLLIAPENAFKGDNYPVTVVNYWDEPADVTLEMSSKSTSGLIARAFTGVVQAKNSIKLDLPVPSDVSDINFKLAMSLNYSQSNIQIKNSTIVPVKGVSGFLTIQTDKKMYKKNQKVLIRVFALDKELMPVNENISLYIKDPSGNRVEMWRNLQPASGVAKAEFLLSDDPALGDWKIHAEQQHGGSEIVNANVTITVDKFVLPRFDVTVDAPPTMYGRSTAPLSIKVTARYTYGENVVGDAKLHVSTTATRIPTNSQTLREGTTTFVLQQDTLRELLKNYAMDIKIKAIVTEGSSKIELEETTSIKLTHSALKIEKIGEEYYSANNPYHFCVTITDDKGQLIPAAEREDYRMTIRRDIETPVQSLPLSSLTVIDAKHVFCGTVRPPFQESLSLQIRVSSEDVSLSKNVHIYPLSTSEKESAGSLGLIPWDTQQNQMSTKSLFNVREDVQFKVLKSAQKADFPVFYQVYSKGESLTNGLVNLGQNTSAMLTIRTSRKMSPSALVIVYGVSNGYLITAMQKIQVSLNLNSQTSMSYGVTRARVASNVTLRVTTPQSNSYVALVAIDKGSELLGAPNDITETQVISGLGMYTMGSAVEQPTDVFDRMFVDGRKRRSFFWPRIYTTFHLLQSVGVLWMTDATVEGENMDLHLQDAILDKDRQPDVQINGNEGLENAVAGFAPSSDQQVRKNFPETFIWMDGQSGADSIFEVRTKLPDSITSWVTRAVVVSPSSGLHIPDVTQIESFKSFFLVVETPPSIIQGEVFEVKVLLFNYIETGPEELQATVSIRGKVDNTAKVWSKELETEPSSSDGVSKTLTVKQGQSSMLAVWVRKLDTEQFSPVLKLIGEATAQTDGQTYTDMIYKDISAEPEGRRIKMTKVISLEASGSTDIPPVEVSFPPSAVKGSKTVYALVMGDMLGQALSNPEKMITVPTGCGEQNMATTVPNIYLLQHLRATETVTTLESKIIQNIKIGYQKELNYKRNDGSYSAFGMNDPSGSTWLTAFVLKSFAEIHRMLPDLVDPNIIIMATSWLNGQVDDRGSVLEPGRVIHTEMQGTMSDSKDKLAAFVLACYAEVLDIFGPEARTEPIFTTAQTKMTAIERLLKGNLPRAVTDPYFSSLLAYALALDGSSTLEVERLTQQLMDNATSYMEGAVEMKCLGKDCGGQDNEQKRPNPLMRMYIVHEPSPSSIEMTGYLLLTLMTSNRSTEALPFLRWLNSKRNSLGGWYSTQDTVVGLKALSEFARSRMEKNKNVQIDVDVIAKENSAILKTKTFQINQNNRILLQREQFPVETTHIEIKPSQAGDAVVTVVWHYNLVEALVDDNIQVTVQKQPVSDQIYDIVACVQYLGSEPSNMALVTVTLGSGMAPDVNQLEGNPSLAKVEVEGSQVHMYINEITQVGQCMKFTAVQTTEVKDAKPVPVKAMLYYKPEVSAVVSYDPAPSSRVRLCENQICSHAGHVTTSSLSLLIMLLAFICFG